MKVITAEEVEAAPAQQAGFISQNNRGKSSSGSARVGLGETNYE